MAMAGVRQRNGFTLLELLIALVVIGFLLAGLAQGVHFGLLTWGIQVRLTSQNDDFSTLDDTVRHVVEAADPGDDINPARFAGSGDRLECVTALPNAAGPEPIRRMQAILLVDSDHRLVLRWRPYLHATRLGPLLPLHETELLRGVSRIELAYWRPGGGWVSAWRSNDLPSLVRVRVDFSAGDPRHWPDIITAPVLDRP